ncbi:MAG: hypothetical protein ABIU09_06330 [Pyrinomonadaceae bacterium]
MRFFSIDRFRFASIAIAIAVSLIAFSFPASAQRRDFMTEQEIEIIRDAQDIDTRIEVLTRMIDRRFSVLAIDVKGWKEAQKQSDIWGELPKGTRLDLFSDIKKLLQKSVDDIDNLASHPDSAPIREKGDKRSKKDPERFGTAVRNLGTAAGRYLAPLKTELDKTTDEKEKGPILHSIDLCDQIIEAVGKLPPEVKKN